jgi:ABC-type Zn uptake system ZnuABC Zn-binding protein ZnuA
MKRSVIICLLFLIAAIGISGCQSKNTPSLNAAPSEDRIGASNLRVLAVETFLADIAQNVAGDRLIVETLLPPEIDPHTFEPTPKDVAKIASSQILILNGAGFEEWLTQTIEGVSGERMIIEASSGLMPRRAQEGEKSDNSLQEETQPAHEIDPHFWLDPINVIKYVENIRDGLIAADPAGKDIYTQNAQAYIAQLKELDSWIQQQLSAIPKDRRLIVTNHESFGYFADRYGFKIIGAIIPSVSADAAPSAQQMVKLVELIRENHVLAIFLETGSNPQLAQQIARETGVTVVTDLYTHSLSAPDGPAPTYLDMMRYNTLNLVNALR